MAFWFNQWFSRNPYTIASVIFMILAVFGWRVLDWGERQLGFLLLLYFIMTLGIRLDEIARAIGGSGGAPRPADRDPESLAAQLREIRLHLRRIQARLDKLPVGDETEERQQQP
jgi:hypothetical protein